MREATAIDISSSTWATGSSRSQDVPALQASVT